MWIGINTEKGKRITDEEAFGYAMNETRKDPKLFEEYKKSVVDWFFSGEWIHKEGKQGENGEF